MSKYLGGGGGVASSVNSYPSSTGADALTSTTCDVMAASNVATCVVNAGARLYHLQAESRDLETVFREVSAGV